MKQKIKVEICINNIIIDNEFEKYFTDTVKSLNDLYNLGQRLQVGDEITIHENDVNYFYNNKHSKDYLNDDLDPENHYKLTSVHFITRGLYFFLQFENS